MAVVEPGTHRRRGANSQGEGVNLLFGPNFPIKCMKMKEIGPRGEAHVPSGPPLDPPMHDGIR